MEREVDTDKSTKGMWRKCGLCSSLLSRVAVNIRFPFQVVPQNNSKDLAGI